MKRRIKWFLVTVTAVVMVLGTSVTAMAASSGSGWKQEGNERCYVGSHGNKVTDKWLTINGKKYRFDSDGNMLYGWHYEGDDIYYLGGKDDGAMKTGWLCLTYNRFNIPDEGDVSRTKSPGSGAECFYFLPNGKAVKAKDGEEYAMKAFSGRRYYFDKNGVMQTGWAAVAPKAEDDVTGISKFRYFGGADDGKMNKGWVFLNTHPSGSDDASDITASSNPKPEEGVGHWYYFDSEGVPKYLKSDAKDIKAATARISGDSYFFDEYGCVKNGLIRFNLKSGDRISAYFNEDGKMQTGRIDNVKEADGTTASYCFNTSGDDRGCGFTGERDHYLYSNGKLVKADRGTGFEVFNVNQKAYLVNEEGKAQTADQFYKVAGKYAYEYEAGKIYRVNDKKERRYEIFSWGALPSIAYTDTYNLK